MRFKDFQDYGHPLIHNGIFPQSGLKTPPTMFSTNTGAVRNADRIWASTPQNRTYRSWSCQGYLRISIFRVAVKSFAVNV